MKFLNNKKKIVNVISMLIFIFFSIIGINSFSQSVAPYTGIDYATNYTNPTAGAACSNIAGINASIGDADFVNGSAEVPLGWSFSGTWNSGLIYYDGPGNELLLVSLHTYTEAWYVSLLLSNGSTTPSQPYYLTLVTSNANGSLNYCGGVVYGFNYERPSQLLDFANYVIPAGIGVIGIVFEPFADGAVDPDPHGVLVLQGTTSSIPCDTLIITNEEICQGDSVLFQGIYYSTTGSYTDSLQTSGGCDSVLTLNLTVNPTYLVYQSQSICQGESILLGGSLQTTAGVYTDSLQTALGCDSLTITTLGVGNIYNDSTTLSICQGQSAFVGGAFQTVAGNYYDTLQTVLGCDSVITTNLTIIPIVNSTITLVGPYCASDSTVILTAVDLGGVWSGNGITNSATGAFNPATAGAGTHAITYGIAGVCGDTDAVNITVNPLPIVSFDADIFSLCEIPLQAFTFYNTTNPTGGMVGSTLWNFDDGSTASGDTVSHSYANTGVYDITLTVTSTIAAGGCPNSLTIPAYVQVFANPTADFTMNPNPTTMFVPTIYFYDQSYLNIVSWTWNFGGLDTSILQNPSYTFPEDTGEYLVTLTVVDNHDCENTITKTAIVTGEYGIYVPNAFTPDFDNLNDGFFPNGFGISDKNYTFFIFDRWGETIFESQTKFTAWDGTYKGKIVSNGVYVWKLVFTDINGKTHTELGHVSIIK